MKKHHMTKTTFIPTDFPTFVSLLWISRGNKELKPASPPQIHQTDFPVGDKMDKTSGFPIFQLDQTDSYLQTVQTKQAGW